MERGSSAPPSVGASAPQKPGPSSAPHDPAPSSAPPPLQLAAGTPPRPPPRTAEEAEQQLPSPVQQRLTNLACHQAWACQQLRAAQRARESQFLLTATVLPQQQALQMHVALQDTARREMEGLIVRQAQERAALVAALRQEEGWRAGGAGAGAAAANAGQQAPPAPLERVYVPTAAQPAAQPIRVSPPAVASTDGQTNGRATGTTDLAPTSTRSPTPPPEEAPALQVSPKSGQDLVDRGVELVRRSLTLHRNSAWLMVRAV